MNIKLLAGYSDAERENRRKVLIESKEALEIINGVLKDMANESLQQLQTLAVQDNVQLKVVEYLTEYSTLNNVINLINSVTKKDK